MASSRRIEPHPNLAQPYEQSERSVKSAMRVLAIFELFDEIRRPLTTSEIAASLDYPFSSTAALVKTLVKAGYLLIEEGSRRHLPSLRAGLLGAWPVQRFGWNGRIVALMEELFAAVGLTVTLYGRNGRHTQILHVIEHPDRTHWHLSPGMVQALPASASGRVILSALPDAEVMRILRRWSAESPAAGETISGAQVLEEVADVRRDGYLFTRRIALDDAAYVGMPLPRAADEPLLVLGVGGPAALIELRRERIIGAMLTLVGRHDRP